MKKIRWDGTLDTGHAVIDADHQNLILLFNRFVSAADRPAGKHFCNHVLDELIEHARAHFQWEERLMTEFGYPEKAQHMAQHAALIDEILNYRFDVGNADAKIPFTELSRNWLTLHMHTADRRLTGFLSGVLPPGNAPG